MLRNKDNRLKLSIFDKLTYCSGGMGFCICFMMIGSYLLYVFTDIFYLSPTVAANIFLFTRFWDAINDPIMGVIVDKRPFAKKGGGIYRPWILLSVPFLVVSLTCCFTMPSFITTDTGKTIWAVTAYVIYTMAQTLGQVPYGSLSNAITTDTEERGSLGAYRNFGENIGNLLVSLLIMGLVGFFGKDGNVARGYSGAALTLGLISAFFLVLCYKFTTENAISSQAADVEHKASLKDCFSMLFKNRPIICLACGIFLAAVVINFKFAYTMYYVFNYMGEGTDTVTTINSVQTGVAILSFWLINWMFTKMEKRTMLILAGIIFTADGLLFFAAKTNVTLVIIGSAFFGFVMSLSFTTIWGAIADGVEYGLWKTGICAPAFLFAMVTFSQKCGIGIASWLAGYSLSAIGYVAGSDMTSSVLHGLYMWHNGTLVAGGILFIIISIPYNLSKSRYCSIIQELDKRAAANK